MEDQKIREQMMQYNSLYKEMDDVYHSLANHFGISDTSLWILYIIRESDGPLIQSMVSEKLSLSKQTINSALKNLEKGGYVELKPLEGSLKNKQIYLTAAGEVLAQKTIDHVFAMEQSAFSQLSEKERTQFLQLNQTYAMLLKQEAEKLLAPPD